MTNVELNSEIINSVVPVLELNFMNIKRVKKLRRLKRKRDKWFDNDFSFGNGFNIFSEKPLLKFPFNINVCGVHNLTGFPLNSSILKFLSLGENFILPANYASTTSEIKASFSDFYRSLRLKSNFQYSEDNESELRVPNPNYQPTKASNEIESYINITKNRLESELLINTNKNMNIHPTFTMCLKALKSASSRIKILRADKNLGLVVLLRKDYENLGIDHLWNTKVYKGLNALPNPISAYRELMSLLINFGFKEDSRVFKYIMQLNENKVKWGSLYFLVKVHKDVKPPPLRPICSQLSSVTYYASKYLSLVLMPIVRKYVPTFIDDPLTLINLIHTVKFDKPVSLAGADIENLYPSIQLEDCLLKVEEFILQYNDGSICVSFVLKLLKFVLENNYFSWEKLFFHQITGIAMGTPCAVVVSIIYVHILEQKAIQSLETWNKPLYLFRWIDDYFGIFSDNTIKSIQLFFDAFKLSNTVYPTSEKRPTV
jgi:hypothetical protein